MVDDVFSTWADSPHHAVCAADCTRSVTPTFDSSPSANAGAINLDRDRRLGSFIRLPYSHLITPVAQP